METGLRFRTSTVFTFPRLLKLFLVTPVSLENAISAAFRFLLESFSKPGIDASEFKLVFAIAVFGAVIPNESVFPASTLQFFSE